MGLGGANMVGREICEEGKDWFVMILLGSFARLVW